MIIRTPANIYNALEHVIEILDDVNNTQEGRKCFNKTIFDILSYTVDTHGIVNVFGTGNNDINPNPIVHHGKERILECFFSIKILHLVEDLGWNNPMIDDGYQLSQEAMDDHACELQIWIISS